MLEAEPELAEILRFTSKTLEAHQNRDEAGNSFVTYIVSERRFDFRCRVRRIPPEDQEEALEWCEMIADAANKAPHALALGDELDE